MFVPDLSRLRPARLASLVVLCSIAALLVAMAAPSRADARVRCAGTFRVLHDDHIGRLSLPRGNYRITLLEAAPLTCAQASDLFARFLEDYDGDLGVWRIIVKTKTFVAAPRAGFHVVPAGNGDGGGGESPGGGRHPVGGSFCPGTFRVLHRDHIGPLQLAAGPYWIVLLQRQGLSCAQASTLFTRFLDAVGGQLPPPWVLEAARAGFRRGAGGPGFRVKPAR